MYFCIILVCLCSSALHSRCGLQKIKRLSCKFLLLHFLYFFPLRYYSAKQMWAAKDKKIQPHRTGAPIVLNDPHKKLGCWIEGWGRYENLNQFWVYIDYEDDILRNSRILLLKHTNHSAIFWPMNKSFWQVLAIPKSIFFSNVYHLFPQMILGSKKVILGFKKLWFFLVILQVWVGIDNPSFRTSWREVTSIANGSWWWS